MKANVDIRNRPVIGIGGIGDNGGTGGAAGPSIDADPVVVLAAARTPIGSFQGDLASMSATALGAHAVRAVVDRAGKGASASVDSVDDVFMGCVLPAGLGQAPARQAALAAGLPLSTACTTINKVCGSGMQALMLGHDRLLVGGANCVVAGGMESMTNAPYLLPKARSGLRLGHGQVIDHMFLDGLEDHYGRGHDGRLMGAFAEDCARRFEFTRDEQDAFAARSTRRAQQAQREGRFDWEIAPITIGSRRGERVIDVDEGVVKADIDKLATLRPAFEADGTVTAGNASSISDGAAALLLARLSTARDRGLAPLARIVAQAHHAEAPEWFTTAPVGAIEKVLARAGWRSDDVDLWEINEAFAVVPLAAIRLLGLDDATVNVHGGACVIGHPIGASGARIVVTLIGALRSRGLRRGVAAICIGGGEATAVAVEMI